MATTVEAKKSSVALLGTPSVVGLEDQNGIRFKENTSSKSKKVYDGFSDENIFSINVPLLSHVFNAIYKGRESPEGNGFRENGQSFNSQDISFVGGITCSKRCDRKSIGQMDKEESNRRPLSFDFACMRLQLSKPNLYVPNSIRKNKKAKKRSVHNLGAKVDPMPSYFAFIAPRTSRGLTQNSSSEAVPITEADPFRLVRSILSHLILIQKSYAATID